MERVIKFRAWDNDKMIDVKILEYVPEHKSFSGKAGFNINHHLGIPAENLMQYTGLKDRNGVEIYEGDIITPCAYRKTTSEEWRKFKCEVIFYEGMFCLKPNGGLIQEHNPLYTSLGRGLKANNEYEVIGNIYENPELLGWQDGK